MHTPAAIEEARPGQLSPRVTRLMSAIERMNDTVLDLQLGQDVPVFGSVNWDSRRS